MLRVCGQISAHCSTSKNSIEDHGAEVWNLLLHWMQLDELQWSLEYARFVPHLLGQLRMELARSAHLGIGQADQGFGNQGNYQGSK